MRLAPYLQATASGRPYTRGSVKKNGQPSSPMAKLAQRNAQVFPGNTGASTLGNRAGDGEVDGHRGLGHGHGVRWILAVVIAGHRRAR